VGDAGDSRANGHGASIQRVPGIEVSWCTCVVSQRMQRYFDDELPSTEVDKRQDIENVLDQMKAAPALGKRFLLLRTPRSTRTSPTIGTLVVTLSPEDVVIKPKALEKRAGEAN
ncbi:hypothetical protein SMMN14_03817, partial [Sphaerulina musiva]